MVRVGLAAPPFDGGAVIAGRSVRLSWRQIQDRALLLLFDPVGAALPHEYAFAVCNAVTRLAGPHARVAVVCPDDLDDVLARANLPRAEGGPGPLEFPLIADPDGRLASLYELRVAGRRPLWGQFLIDPAGILRQMRTSDFPNWAGVDELLRILQSVGIGPAQPRARCVE